MKTYQREHDLSNAVIEGLSSQLFFITRFWSSFFFFQHSRRPSEKNAIALPYVPAPRFQKEERTGCCWVYNTLSATVRRVEEEHFGLIYAVLLSRVFNKMYTYTPKMQYLNHSIRKTSRHAIFWCMRLKHLALEWIEAAGRNGKTRLNYRSIFFFTPGINFYLHE